MKFTVIFETIAGHRWNTIVEADSPSEALRAGEANAHNEHISIGQLLSVEPHHMIPKT